MKKFTATLLLILFPLSAFASTVLIGDETITTDSSVWSNNYNVCVQKTASNTGTMTEYRVKVEANGNMKAAVYTDSGGSPSALLNSTGDTAVTTGQNVITFTDTSISSGTTYWLCFNQQTAPIVSTKTGASSITTKYKALAYASAFPDPFGTPDGSQTTFDTAVAGAGSLPSTAAPSQDQFIIFGKILNILTKEDIFVV